MIKIAITGNIGTGKSTVAKIIKEFGFKVFESDQIVNKLLEEKEKHQVYLMKFMILLKHIKL